jgi:pseudaminic acid biosynthesis-associated methylase
VQRNANAANGRQAFWDDLLGRFPLRTVLEVGCNVGGNVHWLAKALNPRDLYGVDINEEALADLRRDSPGVNAVWSPARTLPFRDGQFDLTFTTGVLIHQAPETLPLVMGELVRCSRRYVLCGEYHADELTEVPYRGQEGALWKRDWGKLYVDLFPELQQRATGFLPRGPDSSWDDVTWWMFEKPGFA